jgi:hypothetical protein
VNPFSLHDVSIYKVAAIRRLGAAAATAAAPVGLTYSENA